MSNTLKHTTGNTLAAEKGVYQNSAEHFGIEISEQGEITLTALTLTDAGLEALGHTQTRRPLHSGSGWGPKYRTPAGQKGKLVYAPAGWVPDPDTPPAWVWITEGCLDAAAWWSHLSHTPQYQRGGLVLGCGGTAVMESPRLATTLKHLLKEWSQHSPVGVTIIADNDRPGVKAAYKLADRLPDNPQNEPKVIVSLEQGWDVCDMAANCAFATAIATRPHPKQAPVKAMTPLAPKDRQQALTEAKEAMSCLAVAQRLKLNVNAQGMIRCFWPDHHKHGDRTPSLSLRAHEGQGWRCHGCGETGDQIDLIRCVTSKTIRQSIELLVHWAGIRLGAQQSPTPTQTTTAAPHAPPTTTVQPVEQEGDLTRQEWLTAATTLAAYGTQQEGKPPPLPDTPDVITVDKTNFVWDKNRRQWNTYPTADTTPLRHKAVHALAVTSNDPEATYAEQTAQNVGEVISRLSNLAAVPSQSHDLTPALCVPYCLILHEPQQGIPWRNCMVSIRDDNTIRAEHRFRDTLTPNGTAPITFDTTFEFYEDRWDGLYPQAMSDFLTWATSNDPYLVDLIWALIGRTLTGHRAHPALPILIGPGGNGKGVILAIISALLGNLTQTATVPAIGNRFWYGTHAAGAHLVTINDMEARPWGPQQAAFDAGLAVLKNFTGGDGDAIAAEVKYHPRASHVNPQLTFWAATNYTPKWIKSSEDAPSWERRIVPIPLNQTVTAENINRTLAADILCNEEDRIATYAVYKYSQWLLADAPLPPVVLKLREEIVRQSLPSWARWANDSLEPSPDSEIAHEDALADFRMWCSENNEESDIPRPKLIRHLRNETRRVAGAIHPVRVGRVAGTRVSYWRGAKFIQTRPEHLMGEPF